MVEVVVEYDVGMKIFNVFKVVDCNGFGIVLLYLDSSYKNYVVLLFV